MTNNEAIGILAIVVETAKGRCFVTDEAISDAYAMAIKALEAQELSKNSPKLDKENGDLQPTCNELATDCISRKAVIDALNGLCDRECEYSKKQRHVMCDACHLGSAFDVLEQLPTQTNATNTLDCVERQAAIDAVEILLEQTEEDADVKTWNNAIRGAINSIKHHVPSTQPELRTQMSSANCISRREAIDILDAFEVKIENGEPFAYSWARMRITELPSAQPERPKGRWMLCDNQRREDMENGNYMYTCTNCLHSDVHAKTVTVPFCWNCGADMMEDDA